MKMIFKILIAVILTVIILFVILNLAFSYFAKGIIVGQIERSLKVKASIDKVNITVPLTVNLIKLKAGELFQADKISISPSLLGFLAGKVVLSRISLVNPVIVLEQSAEGKINIPQHDSKGQPPRVYLAGLTIRNGKVIFIDKKVDAGGFKAILASINADISKVLFPVNSMKANFKVSASFLNLNSAKIGDINLSGWVDFGPKDMDAVLSLQDLDLTYFSPYYGNFISDRQLDSARLNIKSVFSSRNNDLEIVTDFKLSDLVYAQTDSQDAQITSFDITKSALDLFTDAKGELALEFKLKTKLDNPGFNSKELKKIILSSAAKNLAHQNPADLIRKVSDNIERFKDLGKGLERIFKDKN
ncbi:MAG: DUF748 domain-containing protein [Candidatus Omnitrophota bacterium]|jgi:uncharacterized protein involved in outer membrane biogenesis